MVHRRLRCRAHAKGFTLIELMVVVSIIALLISILLPSLARAREQAKATVCASHLSGLFKGIFFYMDDNKNVLPNFSPLYTWGIKDFFWTSQIAKYVPTSLDIYSCPSDKKPVIRYIEGKDLVGKNVDSSSASSGGGGIGGIGGGSTITDLAVPLSYQGTCDHLTSQKWETPNRRGGDAIGGLLPRRLQDYKWPSRDLMLVEVGQERIRNDSNSCFRWGSLQGLYRSDESFRRHYGGTSLQSNGGEFLFFDGHVAWHSAQFTGTKLVCYQRTRAEAPVGGDCDESRYPYPIRNAPGP